MYITITCSSNQITEFVDYYESYGYTLQQKIPLEDTNFNLVFKAASTSHAAEAVMYSEDTTAHIEFSDGSTSPLYVRKLRWMDD